MFSAKLDALTKSAATLPNNIDLRIITPLVDFSLTLLTKFVISDIYINRTN